MDSNRHRHGPCWVLLCCGLAAACGDTGPARYTPVDAPEDAPLAGLVDPFVGTANNGQTFPGPLVPWGLASPSPHTTLTTPLDGLAGIFSNSGYLHGEPHIYGFGQTHLSGVGCPDLGAPMLMPTVGPVQPDWEDNGAAHTDEHAHAGYYSVTLREPERHVELTAGQRVGYHRFWFPGGAGLANVLVDVGRSVSWREDSGEVEVVGPREAQGSVTAGLFCAQANAPVVHFVVRFDADAVETGTWTGGNVSTDPVASGAAGAFFRFDEGAGRPVEAVVGLSYVSLDNARDNLDAAGALGFDEAHEAATSAWQDTLGRIRVEGGTDEARRTFYTALYHALLAPHQVADESGEFPAPGGPGAMVGYDRYTVFSLWDTYRTVHPLLTLVYPERQLDMLHTLVDLSDALDGPPKWELLGEEVNMMVGDPLAIVVADSYLKGLQGFDVERVYDRLIAAARDPALRPGLEDYVALGYVPMEAADDVWGPVSTTLEYNLADAALADLADGLGHSDDASELRARSQSYALFFESDSGLLRPLNADGTWLEPFDPDALEGSSFQEGAGGPGFVEGSAWHYAFFVPHDSAGLVALHGEALFEQRLQALFDEGRYAIWNEPTLAVPYLFNYVAGAAWRAQQAVAEVRQTYFGLGPDGLPGNDDTGTLSAWYVWSALGLYPDAPGKPRYAIGSPLFERAEISLHPDFHAGEVFVIEAPGAGPDAPYVVSARLNGVDLSGWFLDHADVVAGGTLELQMSATPPGGP